MSKRLLLTGQPDQRGLVNASRQAFSAVEALNTSLGITTQDSLFASTYGGTHSAPGFALDRHKRGAEAKSPDNPLRSGPVLVPFSRHHLGEGHGAFNADSHVMPVLDPDAHAVGDAVCFSSFNTDLGLMEVSSDNLADSPVAIVVGIVEDATRRAYFGTTGGYAGENDIVLVQFEGYARANIAQDTPLAFPTHFMSKVYKRHQEGLVTEADKAATDLFVGYAIAPTVAPHPDGTDTNYHFIWFGASAPSAPSAEIDFSFRVKNVTATDFEVSPGKIYIGGQTLPYNGTTSPEAHSGSDEYVGIEVTFTKSSQVYSNPTLIVQATAISDTALSGTTATLRFPIAILTHSPTSAVLRYQTLGDIYDKRITGWDTDSAILQPSGGWAMWNDCMEYKV